MSIPIPLVLALLSKKNNNISRKQLPRSKQEGQIVVQTPKSTYTRNNQNKQNGKYMTSRLGNVANLIGGTKGAKIGRVVSIINTVNTVNNPINALSLLSNRNQSSQSNPLSSLLGGAKGSSSVNSSGLFKNINNMLDGMDSQKKDELLSMAQSIMQPKQ